MDPEQSVVVRPSREVGQAPAASRVAGTGLVAMFLAMYFLSGFSALLYQVVWHRMLAIFSGSDLYATTTIVAAFMAGLGAGSLLGGVVADATSPRWRIGVFALVELAVGAFALVSAWWYYDVLYIRYAHLAESPVVLAAVLFGSLLIPTCGMGMSFPLISKAATPTLALAGRRIGSLYALNTLGAAAGACATVWLWMGALDFPAILRIGASLNVGVAALAVLAGAVSWTWHGHATADEHEARDATPAPHTDVPLRRWMAIYALAGFLALSWEIVWFRLLGVILKSNSLTFPHLLSIYLASLALGIIAGARLVHRGRRPGRVFLALQAGATVLAGVALAALFRTVHRSRSLEWLWTHLGSYDPLDVAAVRNAAAAWLADPGSLPFTLTGSEPGVFELYLLVPVVVMTPSTILMGASFAFLQRAVQNDRAVLGRRVGWLQAANIAGATLGAVLTGLVFLHLLGTAWTSRILIAAGGTFPLLWAAQACRSRVLRAVAFTATAAGTAALMASVPSGPRLWAYLHGSPPEAILTAEDGTGVSALKNERASFSSTTVVYVNGLGQSWIPYPALSNIHSRLGILPIVIHPDPKEVAVIGLGSGDTAYSLGGRQETTAITCIEIVRPQMATLRLLQARRPYGGLEGLLHDPRVQFVFTDGRTYLGRGTRTYDVIEADALRPDSAFAGNLYSYEYFMLLRSRLKRGGLAVTWAPTDRVRTTFARAFPYGLEVGPVLLGSEEPIEYDPDVIRMRAQEPFTQAHYARAGIDVMAAVSPLLEGEAQPFSSESYPQHDINTDLHPKDEYGR